MSQDTTQENRQFVKVIPGDVWELEDMTWGKMRFYQTISEFWLAKRDCYLSNAAIMERTGIKSIKDISKFFRYFEDLGFIKRTLINGRRYIIEPRNRIECEPLPEETNTDGLWQKEEGGYGSSQRGGMATARHNIKKEFKKENKEKQVKETPGPSDDISPSSNQPLKSVFQNTPSGAPSSFGDHGFDQWFEMYPKKFGKSQAAKLWRQNNLAMKSDHMIEVLKEDLSTGGQLHPSTVEPKFVPKPSTYLEDERWKRENRVSADGKPSLSEEEKAQLERKYQDFLKKQDSVHDDRMAKLRSMQVSNSGGAKQE